MSKEINWENVEFKGSKRFLSNMYPCRVVCDGISFHSSENFYMYSKFITTDRDLALSMRYILPKESKWIANKNKDKIRSDWDEVKVDIMREALNSKFTQNSGLRSKLLATGDEYLEERNDWYDVFWGTYLGKGENMLGKLLMELREELTNESSKEKD